MKKFKKEGDKAKKEMMLEEAEKGIKTRKT
jgi:hypothetical protein